MKTVSPPSLVRVSARLAGITALFLALMEVLIDWTTEIKLNVSILYGLPLVVAAAARSRRLLWALTVFLLATTFAVYYVQIPAGVFWLSEEHFVNRLLAALAMIVTACLVHIGLIAADLLDAQRRSLKEQNEELDRCRREAEEASGRKTRFLASVSHDIRTPVSTINLMAEILCRAADNPALTSEIPDIAHRLQANALTLADLVGEVLDVARLDAVHVDLHLSDFSLNDLLAEESNRALPLAEAKKLWLKVEAPDAALQLRTDRVKLVRIIGNLLGNAIKFTNTGGVTLAAARGPEGTVLIRVCDTGVGIAPEQMEHIFGEFVQLQNAERDRSKGYGLGLAICRRLVEALGGHITVESLSGHGSTFTVQLPSSCVVHTPHSGASAPPNEKGTDEQGAWLAELGCRTAGPVPLPSPCGGATRCQQG